MRRPVLPLLARLLASTTLPLLPAVPAVALPSLVMLGACSVIAPPRIQHGVHVTDDQLKELVPGTTTRADATALLGAPTGRGSFDDNVWFYISEVTQARIAQMPAVRSQNVIVLTFDDSGILRDVKHLDQDDSQDVNVVSRTTPSPGTEASFMQQLLGNIGKFVPNAPSSGGGGLNGSGL